VNPLDQRPDFGDETPLFGSEEHAESPCQVDPEPPRMAPRQALIDDDKIGVGFLSQREDFRFASVQVRQQVGPSRVLERCGPDPIGPLEIGDSGLPSPSP